MRKRLGALLAIIASGLTNSLVLTGVDGIRQLAAIGLLIVAALLLSRLLACRAGHSKNR